MGNSLMCPHANSQIRMRKERRASTFFSQEKSAKCEQKIVSLKTLFCETVDHRLTEIREYYAGI